MRRECATASCSVTSCTFLSGVSPHKVDLERVVVRVIARRSKKR